MTTRDALGIVTRSGDTYEVTFERRIGKPIAKVWAAVTVPERIADWLAEAEVDLRVGGHYRLRFPGGYGMDGVITALQPPQLLEYTWPDPEHPNSVVRVSLEADGEGCRLTLVQTALSRKVARGVVGGWHTHLEGLPGAAGGVRTAWTQVREDELLELYKDRLPV
ncbi:MAG: SRPBCC family protein [Phenylobacterium sp.]|uniref:SRPBCC family protein n=1 Tax=Phenylobacterium sp. TaxID=1871053 RepID=UPI00273708D7|nr:SRPBCC family protein [Phenylobacterium sp.]MDP3747457.1 SRPBCC family protein [Phenylobacterium sp.]